MTLLMMRSIRSSRIVSCVTVGLCCVDSTIASMRTGRVALVLDRDLRLAVRPEVVDDARAAQLRQPAHELVRQHDRQRHELGRLRARVPEHQALVACPAGVDALADVARLFVDRREDGARLVVEAVLRARVADVLDDLADDLLEIDVAVGGDLAGNDGQPRRHERFARDAGDRILREDGIENAVGNLIGDFVGMTFGD